MKHVLSTRTARRTVAPEMYVLRGWSLALIMATLFLGCTKDFHHVYTDGSFRSIPGEGTAIFVWAEDGAMREIVQTWLQNHGLTVLDQASLLQGTQSCEGCDSQAVLAHAKSLHAEQVVFAQFTQNADQLTVSIRALSVENEADLWRGTARERFPADIAGEQFRADLVLLTCHALATVWRYRPAGYLRNAPSIDYCSYHF